MTKKSLTVVSAPREGIGLPTVMDPALAAKHGIPYVRAAAFAIDVDRIRFLDEEDERPFGWEIFLTEIYLAENFDPDSDRARQCIEDICLEILESAPTEELLGSQIPFAVFDAVERKLWPSSMSKALTSWNKKAKNRRELTRALDKLFADQDANIISLAESCLLDDLDPPLPQPTLQALRWMIESRRP